MKIFKVSVLVIILVASGIYWYVESRQVPNIFETDGNQVYVENGIKYKRYWNPDLGLTFGYRLEPNGYTLIEKDIKELQNNSVIKYLMLFNTAEHEELLSATEPRDGPPIISIMILKNPDNLEVFTWLKDNGFITNYREGETVLQPVELGGAKGVRYKADGLYQDDVVVLNNNYSIYVFTGSYNSPEDVIRKDFLAFLQTINLF